MAVKTVSDGGKEADMHGWSGGRRTETEDANKANVRMMKSHDTMTVLGSDT